MQLGLRLHQDLVSWTMLPLTRPCPAACEGEHTALLGLSSGSSGAILVLEFTAAQADERR